MFLYCSTSTLKPIVGIVWMFSSESFCNRSADRLCKMCDYFKAQRNRGRGTEGEDRDSHNIVVFPALSRPRINIRTSFEPNRL
jgi:hypothetical protein